ncbi:MAG: hypothetical protein A2289_02215 [Deltaproteobacteria bacterium RIFOXYA12_FULL_58_15]|nr:MAG: hypothetical protein A2289_02215 [Deltaproteobacteria bacterium RIFOXYA12_FULL_58_15]OGR08660.1 MAG: hypothetical protein A2341_00945 [Deltaproteobacteria bacterium RIFOXYB12_FULL_58_9]
MPLVEQDVVIDAPIERVFDVITDYESYPEFLPEMRHVQLVSRNEEIAIVSFELEIIMRVGYTVRIIEDRPGSVTWTLQDAKMMSVNNGGWKLQARGNQTHVTYGLEIRLRGLIPKSVSTRLMGTTLPNTLACFKARAEEISADGSHR